MTEERKTLTEDEREKLREEIDAHDDAIKKIEIARKPLDDALHAACELKEMTLERYEAEIVGVCESCERLLLAGDMGHWGEDANLCEEHAPSWADYKRHLDDPDNGMESEDFECARQAIEGHLAGGGSLDDKILHELG